MNCIAAHRAVDRAGQRLGELRLADAGDVLDEQVTLGEQHGQAEPDRVALALDHLLDVGGDPRGRRRGHRVDAIRRPASGGARSSRRGAAATGSVQVVHGRCPSVRVAGLACPDAARVRRVCRSRPAPCALAPAPSVVRGRSARHCRGMPGRSLARGQLWVTSGAQWGVSGDAGSRRRGTRSGGECRCSSAPHTPRLDDKGRLALPARFRPDLEGGLVISRARTAASTSSRSPSSAGSPRRCAARRDRPAGARLQPRVVRQRVERDPGRRRAASPSRRRCGTTPAWKGLRGHRREHPHRGLGRRGLGRTTSTTPSRLRRLAEEVLPGVL